MSFFVNNTELKSVYYNSQKISEVYFNNVRVWKESYPWVGWANANWSDIYNLCKAKQNGDIEAWPADVVLGATKTTTLTSAVAGSSSYEMAIIGIDIDGPGVLTFQSKTVSSSTVAFSPIGWDNPNCKVRIACESFYANCNAKAYIKPLVKNTFAYNNDDITTNMVKTTDYVWILSDYELGILDLGSYENTYWQIQPQTTEGVNIPYPCYSDNASRVKKKNGGYSGEKYWTRTFTHSRSHYGMNLHIDSSGNWSASISSSGACYLCPAFAIG